jgi:hypothetical protein
VESPEAWQFTVGLLHARGFQSHFGEDIAMIFITDQPDHSVNKQ